MGSRGVNGPRRGGPLILDCIDPAGREANTRSVRPRGWRRRRAPSGEHGATRMPTEPPRNAPYLPEMPSKPPRETAATTACPPSGGPGIRGSRCPGVGQPNLPRDHRSSVCIGERKRRSDEGPAAAGTEAVGNPGTARNALQTPRKWLETLRRTASGPTPDSPVGSRKRRCTDAEHLLDKMCRRRYNEHSGTVALRAPAER